jgi:hypothetical protein
MCRSNSLQPEHGVNSFFEQPPASEHQSLHRPSPDLQHPCNGPVVELVDRRINQRQPVLVGQPPELLVNEPIEFVSTGRELRVKSTRRLMVNTQVRLIRPIPATSGLAPMVDSDAMGDRVDPC